MREQRSVLQDIDMVIVGLYLLLVLMGWLNIYAAVYNEEHKSILDMSQNYGKQLMWIGTALMLAFIILTIDGSFYEKFSFTIFIFSILILISVQFIGIEIKGSRSWFAVGEFRIQPAEFAKFATCLALASYLSDQASRMENFKTKVMAGIIVGLPALLIILQNETGTALVFGALIFVLYREGLSGNILLFGLLIVVLFILTLLFNKMAMIYILSGVAITLFLLMRKKLKNIITLAAVFTIVSGFVYSVDYMFENKLQPHQKRRINVLLGKETDIKGAGYNVNQSKIAIGSGGFIGKGYLQGTQTKYDFVPEQSTDFIFCTIGEEWGFVGSTVVIALFIFLLIRIVTVAENQKSPFSRIYGYGVASILFFHLVINIGMTIGLAPVIGIPLPFFSYGGSSLWSFTILLFIFIRLDAYRLQVLK